MRTLIIHVFLASFAKMGKVEVTKRCVVLITKKSSHFAPLDLAKTFTGSLFPHSQSKSVQFSRRYIRKCLPDSLQYRRDSPFRLLADKNITYIASDRQPPSCLTPRPTDCCRYVRCFSLLCIRHTCLVSPSVPNGP